MIDNKLILEYFCDNYNLSSIEEIEHLATYIDDFVDDKCKYCKHITCSENDECRDGIIEYLQSNLL